MHRHTLASASLALALGCSQNPQGNDSPQPDPAPEPTLALSGSASAQACEAVTITATKEHSEAAIAWRVEGYPVLGLTQDGDTLGFRAPASARGESLVVTATLGELEETFAVEVAPAPALEGGAGGMAPDCAPFRHGVASGDPTQDSVLVWTKLSTDAQSGDGGLTWAVAKDAFFSEVVASGEVATSEERARTALVEVTGLEPGTHYYYRFEDAAGRPSATGRTKTAAADGAAKASFAVASCSSIYSGYFNAYRRIAERELDAVIHLGDYVYDFADEDEPVRIPEGGAIEPSDYASWVAVHDYHLADPDLRAARAAHPWVVMWDNHDVEWKAPEREWDGSVKAFREHVPMRLDDPERPERAWRALAWGDLVDVIMMDVLMHRESGDTVPGTQDPSILGNEQFAWLDDRLTNTRTAWRTLGTQKVMGTIRVNPTIGMGREIFDPKTWDGFPSSRTRLLSRLDELELVDNVALSGDSHVSIALDLVDAPDDYDPALEGGSVGVEVLPTSISRGNFDEELGGNSGIILNIKRDTLQRNPHHYYMDLVQHGYGVMTFEPERMTARIYYSDILAPAGEETLGAELVTERGAGRWTRE